MPQDHTFRRLHDAGFRHLLPIIPHDATISRHSHALQGREDALGKIPGKRVADGWVGLAGWEAHEASEADLDEWAEDGAGVGMRCEDVVAIDIDVTDPALVRLIKMEAITHLGFAPTRLGNAPKCLLLFRTGTPLPTKRTLTFRDWADNRHLIELLGARQQFVVSGIHPKTGRPYTWDDHPADLGYEALPRVTLEELDTFLAACRETLLVFDCEGLTTHAGHEYSDRSPEALKAPDLDLLARTLAEIPNGEDNGYQELATMAHAVRAAAVDDPDMGLDMLQTWSQKWPHGDDPDETARIYWSVHGSSIGVQWLYDRAREAGVDTLAGDFGEVAANDDDEPEPAASEGDTLMERYVYANHIKRFIERKTGLRLDKEQLNDRHLVPDAKKPAAKIFLETRLPGTFADATDYVPGQPGGVYVDGESGRRLYNTWRPGPAQVPNGAWQYGSRNDMAVRLWLRLAEHIVPDDHERGQLFDWLASLLQRPGVKPSWHPLLGSAVHGTGKDSLFAPIVRGLGHNARTITASDIEGDWTWWAEDVQLVVVSEMHSFERRSVMNKMKSYMAAPPNSIGINIKGIPQFDVRNTFGMVMFSNNEDAVAIEKGDRRFYVLWGEKPPLDDAFYEQYHDWLDDGGAAAVCRWLLDRDISAFNPKSRAPETQAKEAMREAAMGQLDGLLHMGIEDEAGPFQRDLVTLAEVADWLKPQVKSLPGPHKLGAALKAAGCVALGQVRIGQQRERVYVCRRGAMYDRLRLTQIRNLLIEQREKDSGASADFGEDDDEDRRR